MKNAAMNDGLCEEELKLVTGGGGKKLKPTPTYIEYGDKGGGPRSQVDGYSEHGAPIIDDIKRDKGE